MSRRPPRPLDQPDQSPDPSPDQAAQPGAADHDDPASGGTVVVTRAAATAGGPGGTVAVRRIHRVHRGRPHFLPRTPRLLRIVGPGLITGAADDDPSGIGSYSQTGAAFGLGLLWVALYLLPLMIAVQEMCARIGLVTGQGLAGVVRRSYSRWILYSAVALLFIANTINVGADLGAMVASTRLLAPGIPAIPLLFIIALGVLGLEIFIPYRQYAQVLKYLALSLLAYVVTGLIIGGDWRTLLAATFIPHIEFTPEYLTLLVAFIGTTISPYLFFWQASEEVEENAALERELKQASSRRRMRTLTGKLKQIRLDTFAGMLASEVTAWFIIQTTAGTLHAHGVTNITTAAQAAQALEPFAHGLPYAGEIAKALFALGVVGTGLLAVPVLAGSAAYGVAEAFGWNEGLAKVFNQARGFYGVIALSTLLGLVFNLLGVDPIGALVFAAVINAIVAVPLLGLILLVANNKRVMGDFTNGRVANTFGVVALVGMAAAAIISLFFLIPGL